MPPTSKYLPLLVGFMSESVDPEFGIEVTDICRTLGCSDETVRRLLKSNYNMFRMIRDSNPERWYFVNGSREAEYQLRKYQMSIGSAVSPNTVFNQIKIPAKTSEKPGRLDGNDTDLPQPIKTEYQYLTQEMMANLDTSVARDSLEMTMKTHTQGISKMLDTDKKDWDGIIIRLEALLYLAKSEKKR